MENSPIIKVLEILRKVVFIIAVPVVICSSYKFVIGNHEEAWGYIVLYLVGIALLSFFSFLILSFFGEVWIFEKIGDWLRKNLGRWRN